MSLEEVVSEGPSLRVFGSVEVQAARGHVVKCRAGKEYCTSLCTVRSRFLRHILQETSGCTAMLRCKVRVATCFAWGYEFTLYHKRLYYAITNL